MSKYWPILAVIVIICGITFNVWHKHTLDVEAAAEARALRLAAEETAAKQQLRAKQQGAWKIEPLPAKLPTLGSHPILPPMPDVVRDENGSVSVLPRIQYLIQNHPIEEIRVGLDEALQHHELILDLQIQEGLEAEFRYVPSGMMGKVNMALIKPAYPVLVLNPRTIEHATNPEQILFLMLVIYHEYQHYKDWLGSDQTVRNYYLPRNQQTRRPPVLCADQWRGELNAYQKECQVALDWNVVTGIEEICLRSQDDVDFRRTLFVSIANGAQGRAAPECIPTWARLAGHPHPEAYE